MALGEGIDLEMLEALVDSELVVVQKAHKKAAADEGTNENRLLADDTSSPPGPNLEPPAQPTAPESPAAPPAPEPPTAPPAPEPPTAPPAPEPTAAPAATKKK